MTVENIKALMDACYQAKRVRELLPTLPKGVTPSYIHYLDIIERLEAQGVQVKVSDISSALNIPCPGVTRTVTAMERGGYIRKVASPTDGRVTDLVVTDAGKRLSQTYNTNFFARLAPLLNDVSDEEAACTVRTIEKLYSIMSEGGISIES